MCVWARWAGFCNVFRLLGLCDFPFQKKTEAMLIVGCIPIAVFFPTSSGLDQKYAVAVAVLHPGYIVGVLSLWQDCDYRATTIQ